MVLVPASQGGARNLSGVGASSIGPGGAPPPGAPGAAPGAASLNPHRDKLADGLKVGGHAGSRGQGLA